MEPCPRNIFVFPPYQFYPDSGELHIRERVVRCPSQAARTLDVLLQHAGEVITREQLRDELWPEGDSLSYDDAINKAISYLRYVLRDNSRAPKYIQTLPKRGYRFVAPVTRIEAEAASTPSASESLVESVELPPIVEEDILEPFPPDAPVEILPQQPRQGWIRSHWRGAATVFLLILLAGGVTLWQYRPHSSNTKQQAHFLRVGIAPFEVEGNDANGLAESFRLDLTDELAQSPLLRVTAAHITRAGAGDRRGMLALQANVLVFGKLRIGRGHITLQLELARGDDATHLATFKYVVEEKDLIVLRQLAQKDLLTALNSPRAGEGSALGSTNDSQAYAIYLQARAHLQQWNPTSWNSAAGEFRQAIARDPGFARAYSGLATTLITMAEHGVISTKEGSEEARQMGQKALELDPQLAEGHAVLGYIAYLHDWDFVIAEREYRQAIELDPAQSHYRVWLADLMCMQGRFDQSIREISLAHSLDPAWKAPYVAAIFIFASAGQPERSIAVGKQVLDMDPDSFLAHHQLGWTYWYFGQYQQAIEEWKTSAKLGKDADRVELESQGEEMLRTGGPKAYAELRLKALESDKKWQHADTDFVPSEWFVYAGQVDNAIAALNSQIDRHDPAALQIATDPAYASLRHDPRYQMLLRRMGMTAPIQLGRKSWQQLWE